ncbi:NAD(P)-dependent oxidoreductase [Arthrobacter sp. Leaf337]|uniref:SDR family oxidoreductase n=1 Tax=Arthrobacter sp. Leaf337 TaxID=1736342 RepID=UPI0006F41E91|nr:SDR family oxidoreductase [Arthrobacter sp. Leaf337]KQR63523.1 NAD(P)-dependent oxidoreductase [Arthrobacter sp. Leaf337]
MSIVIAGATGQLGRLVVRELLGRGVPVEQIVAAGRSAQQLAELAAYGVRTATVDYDDPATVDAALDEGDTLLLISGSDIQNRSTQHETVIGAAVRAKVAHILYTSVLAADTNELVLAPDHAKAEEAIRASGLPFTFLRNGWYTENYAAALLTARETGTLLASAGEGRVASATRADYAAAIAAVLTTPGHEGRVYELSGDYAWTFGELASAFSTVLERNVSYLPVSSAEHVSALEAAGLDPATAGFLAALDGNIRQGALALTTGDLARLAGRPTTPLVDGLRPLAG